MRFEDPASPDAQQPYSLLPGFPDEAASGIVERLLKTVEELMQSNRELEARVAKLEQERSTTSSTADSSSLGVTMTSHSAADSRGRGGTFPGPGLRGALADLLPAEYVSPTPPKR